MIATNCHGEAKAIISLQIHAKGTRAQKLYTLANSGQPQHYRIIPGIDKDKKNAKHDNVTHG